MTYGIKFDEPIDAMVLRSVIGHKPCPPKRESFVGANRRGNGFFVSIDSRGYEVTTPFYPGAYHFDKEAAYEIAQIAEEYQQAIAPLMDRYAAVVARLKKIETPER